MPPRAHARRCAWATWATTAARSAFSSAVAVARRGEARLGAAQGSEAWRGEARRGEARRGEAWGSEARRGEARRVGVCNLPKRLQRGVYGTASTAWRGAASIARRLWRGAVRRILRLCCARTLFPIKSVQRSRTSM